MALKNQKKNTCQDVKVITTDFYIMACNFAPISLFKNWVIACLLWGF